MSASAHAPNLPAEIRRTLLLAGPLIVGQVTSYGMSFVDTVMAGRLGALDLAAVAVGSSVWSAGMVFVVGLMMAVSAAVSQLEGAGRRRQAGELTRQALWLALMVSAVLFVLMRRGEWVMSLIGVEPAVADLANRYLLAISWGVPALAGMFVLRFFSEGIGYTRPTMYIGVVGILINVPLNYVLMFGKLGFPQLGAEGCGWATAIVLWLQLGMIASWILWRPRYRPFQVFSRFDGPDRREILALARLGLPIGLMVFLEVSLFVAAALAIGTLGTIPVAAHQVAINYSGLIFMVPLGLSGAITVRVGNAVGRKDRAGARRAGVVGMMMALAFGALSSLVIVLFPETIVRLYTSDPAVIALAASLLFFAAVFQLADCLQVSAAGALRGLKDTRVPMLYSILAYWLVGMSLGWWLTFRLDWGPAGMWCGIIAGLTVAAFLLGGRFMRITASWNEIREVAREPRG
ncbi:MATE family efflux transporter [Wenzhouxiangella sp. XN201]|uniref:MATE family efflux transporter n=1 Tax=Wenzhouxiangella sp. XN201 TaxID=2710755 RepID=UPI0013CA2BD3|nr:MATE family efflux transporter [Wenzhouxiangella sp. XN201]NEZ03034.1 MATE family efflux transporter [Wenzhouxiangella sp. XN201]